MVSSVRAKIFLWLLAIIVSASNWDHDSSFSFLSSSALAGLSRNARSPWVPSVATSLSATSSCVFFSHIFLRPASHSGLGILVASNHPDALLHQETFRIQSHSSKWCLGLTCKQLYFRVSARSFHHLVHRLFLLLLVLMADLSIELLLDPIGVNQRMTAIFLTMVARSQRL